MEVNVALGVGVSVLAAVLKETLVAVFGVPGIESISTNPMIVRALLDSNSWSPIGRSFVRGLYVALTSISTRSCADPEFNTMPVSTLPVHVSNGVVPGPWS